MSLFDGRAEYTPESDRPLKQLQEALAELDRVMAEYIPATQVGATGDDVALAACVVQARAGAAIADAVYSLRLELTLTNNYLSQLKR